MSEQKHTDWRVSETMWNGVTVPCVVAANGQTICILPYCYEDEECDAALIAAAPSLLAELEQAAVEIAEAANLLEPTYPGVATIFRKAAERKRALVAKSTQSTVGGE